MTRIFREEDASLEPILRKTLAIIGYGNQGRAQALNLRDSGVRVIVGNADDGYAAQGRKDGFEVYSIAEAARRGDIVMMLLPDEVTPAIFRDQVKGGLSAGKTLVFASGYCVAYDQIAFPEDINVIMVAPRTMGEVVREYYEQGRGFLSFVAVHQDADGTAWDTALALAKGIGSLKEMALEVSFKDETELDLFTEQALIPAISVALKNAVEVLLEAGYPKMPAVLEMYLSGELGDVLHKSAERGWVGQGVLHSPTSRYGTKSRLHLFDTPALKQTMQAVLVDVQNGKFAEEWSAEQAAGYPKFHAFEKALSETAFAQAEREVLALILEYRK
jgi:ketol-acid reductoisomerase